MKNQHFLQGHLNIRTAKLPGSHADKVKSFAKHQANLNNPNTSYIQLLFVCKYVSVCKYKCSYIYRCMCVYGHAYEGQKTTYKGSSSILHFKQINFTVVLVIFKQYLPLTWNIPHRLTWLTSALAESAYLELGLPAQINMFGIL